MEYGYMIQLKMMMMIICTHGEKLAERPSNSELHDIYQSSPLFPCRQLPLELLTTASCVSSAVPHTWVDSQQRGCSSSAQQRQSSAGPAILNSVSITAHARQKCWQWELTFISALVQKKSLRQLNQDESKHRWLMTLDQLHITFSKSYLLCFVPKVILCTCSKNNKSQDFFQKTLQMSASIQNFPRNNN